MQLDEIQNALAEQQMDGWLFYDHHHRDPIAYRILGLDPAMHVTRRWFYFVPARGEPRKLVHRIEQGRLDTLPGARQVYSSWQELEAGLAAMLGSSKRVAMQYSPRNAIMYVAMVDAGTVELVRSLGHEVVSSADLVSRFEAVLNEAQIATHYEAQRRLDAILAEGFRETARVVAAGRATEYGIHCWLKQAIEREGMLTENGPNVSVNAHSSDSHYEPKAGAAAQIRQGDFLLIDVWARMTAPGSCWYDITWTGVVGREPTGREQQVFDAVRDARDAAIDALQQAFRARAPIAGWQADDAARRVIAQAGLGAYFTHRTGHSISTEIHGNGANLDNLETHDERRILPFTCFSVEPGVYLPEFGVRSEINMMTTAEDAVVTGRVQRELMRI